MASPFGSHSVFGQTSSDAANPFAQNTFGSPNTFGSSLGSAFGQPPTTTFGAFPSQAFGSTSSPASGSSFSGQKPSFGSSPSQLTPFGSMIQQTQLPAFGSTGCVSTTPFGAASRSAFCFGSTPSFGSTNTVACGATAARAHGGAGIAPAFGARTTPAFGCTSTGTTLAVSSVPAFGSTGFPAFGSQSASPFGTLSTPALSAQSRSSFGAANIPTFGTSSTAPTSSFGLAQYCFVHSASRSGTAQCGATPWPSQSQSSSFGTQTAIPTFGTQGGSRVARHTSTPIEFDGPNGTKSDGKIVSISAMPVYKDKSHAELRWQDYQCGDKGGPIYAGQPAPVVRFPSSKQGSSTSGYVGILGQNTAALSSSNLFAPTTSTLGLTVSAPTSTSFLNPTFTTPSRNPFGSISPSTSTFVGPIIPSFTFSPPTLGSSLVGSNSAFSPSIVLNNTQSSGLFLSSTPSIVHTPFPSVQLTNGFQPTSSSSSTLLSRPSTGFWGHLASSSAPSVCPTSTSTGCGQITNSLSTNFQPVSPAPMSSMFPSGNLSQTQPASSNGFSNVSSILGQPTFQQLDSTHPNMVKHPVPTTNPLGTLTTLPQIPTFPVCPAPSVQYGISSMPVDEKPSLVRISTLSAPRHLSRRRIRLPVRKYNPKVGPKLVPFFMDDAELSAAPKTNIHFVPRENPRLVFNRPNEQWISRISTEGKPEKKGSHNSADKDGQEGDAREENASQTTGQKPNGVPNEYSPEETDTSNITIGGHEADIEALTPKLRHSDYFTEPRIQELAARERTEPGFCRRVKDFVVGRHGYGCIKFDGETDVRRLDLESIIQFGNREVIVYEDEKEKPPAGQGLNKPAVVTLLNVKCIDKKTGQQFTEGPNVDKYRLMLMKRAEEQGAEPVSFDAVRGLWTFKVDHFSCYKF